MSSTSAGEAIATYFDKFPPVIQSAILAITAATFFRSAIKQFLRKSPAENSVQRQVEDYLKSPVYPDGKLELHLNDTRAYWIFKKLSGIRCKKPMRDALINLHESEDIPNSWSWGFLADASKHLEFENWRLAYRVNGWERFFQLVHYAMMTLSGGAALILCGLIIVVDDTSSALVLLVFEGILMGVSFFFLSQSLPLERARQLKRHLNMPYYSYSWQLSPSAIRQGIIKYLYKRRKNADGSP
jgi:hypothetical protein